MVTLKSILMLLTFGIILQQLQAGIITVNKGEDLNAIINSAQGGDTVVIKPGTFNKVNLSNKNFSKKKPLIIRSSGTETVIVKGDTISKGSAVELSNCSYISFEGISFTNAMWGIYVKNSEHILIRNNKVYYTGQEGCHIGRSSKYVDVIGNTIHHTGRFNSKWGEGIYVGSGSYGGRNNFPDNCEHVWIEGNQIYETGNAEGINVKGECFHVTVRNNKIHDIHPGTSVQYNQAGITVEGSENSIKNGYRVSEKRDVWVENNTIENVSGGHADWNNGIMFFGTGVYILNNTIKNCINKGIYGNDWKNLGLQNFVYGNTISDCGTIMYIHPELKVTESDPGKNPHSPQKWYDNF